MDKKAVDAARSLYYGLFSKMLVFSEAENRFEGLKEVLEVMAANPMDTNSGEALKELQAYTNEEGYALLAEEYDAIFHDPENSIVRTTASFYAEGLESGKKLVEVRQFVAKTRIRRDEKQFREPEDSIGFLMTFMHELVELVISGEVSYLPVQHCLFDEVLNLFLDRFVPNLYEHPSANAYKSLAIVMHAFTAFERLYFGIGKPEAPEVESRTGEACDFISDKEARRRAENRIARSADTLVASCSLENDDDSEGILEQ